MCQSNFSFVENSDCCLKKLSNRFYLFSVRRIIYFHKHAFLEFLLITMKFNLTCLVGNWNFHNFFPFQIAVYGKNFNKSARDAWELFQSTGVEALVAYDCSGSVLLMGTLLGGLITGTCAGVWSRIKYPDRVIMIGSTAMLMGMILVSFSKYACIFDLSLFFTCSLAILILLYDAELL